MFFNPLEQFEVIIYLNFSILNFDFSLTNSGFYMFLITVVPLILFSLSFWFSYVISSSWQLFVELLYKFVLNLFVRQTGQLSALRYFPLFFCVFLFVLFSNLLGLLPFGFTVTSHILITAFIAFFIFVGITFRGFFVYNIHFLKLYIVSGVPTWLLPILTVIEVLSYWMRPISLSVRLFANMLAGHTLLNIISGFSLGFFKKFFFLSAIPVLLILAISTLEFGVALLQAYVFLNLLLIYLSDTLSLHH